MAIEVLQAYNPYRGRLHKDFRLHSKQPDKMERK